MPDATGRDALAAARGRPRRELSGGGGRRPGRQDAAGPAADRPEAARDRRRRGRERPVPRAASRRWPQAEGRRAVHPAAVALHRQRGDGRDRLREARRRAVPTSTSTSRPAWSGRPSGEPDSPWRRRFQPGGRGRRKCGRGIASRMARCCSSRSWRRRGPGPARRVVGISSGRSLAGGGAVAVGRCGGMSASAIS